MVPVQIHLVFLLGEMMVLVTLADLIREMEKATTHSNVSIPWGSMAVGHSPQYPHVLFGHLYKQFGFRRGKVRTSRTQRQLFIQTHGLR
jgi:hypothetical protein